jgi:putative membrane protein insertion efficiency factor
VPGRSHPLCEAQDKGKTLFFGSEEFCHRSRLDKNFSSWLAKKIALAKGRGMGRRFVRWSVKFLFAVYGWVAPSFVALFGPAARCRFVPSCSVYARQHILRHGLLRSIGPILRRLLRCHPFHPSGFDPVPD